MKVACTVLRGGSGGNADPLPGDFGIDYDWPRRIGGESLNLESCDRSDQSDPSDQDKRKEIIHG